jgi:hypothetical protein
MLYRFRVTKSCIIICVLLIVIFVVFIPNTAFGELDENFTLVIDTNTNYRRTTPGHEVTFNIELDNHGDERINVYCDILDCPKDWKANIVSSVELGPKTIYGGSMSTILLFVQPPEDFGYHNERETIRVSFTPADYYNSSLKGIEVIETFTVSCRGFSPAGLDTAISIVLLLVCISIVVLVVKKYWK